MEDPHHLQRFVNAQEPVYAQVCAELRQGQKRGHWIWYIFPQIAGLGYSSMSQRFAIASLDEAKAYLQHPVLGPRLRECCELMLAIEGRSITSIFPYPDDLKLRSSMTLFAHATEEEDLFQRVRDKYFDGAFDASTIERL